MPIEIKELIIRAIIKNDNDGAGATNGDANSAKAASNIDKDEIIAECVDQVMNILERSKER